MATAVILPRLGQGMESGTIVRWLKSEGEQVVEGEPLFELDTDKVTQEVEAETSGVLLRIAVAEGEVPVGQTVAFIGAAGEEVADTGQAAEPVASEPAPAAPPEAPTTGDGRAKTAEARVKASPLARRIARERGVRLAAVSGTGPDGRIVAEDVERAGAGPARPVGPVVAAGEVESRPLSNVRRTIARRLTEAWKVPAFQLTVSVDMTRATELVARQRELRPDVRITVTDLLAKLCANALALHPDVNVQFAGDALLVFPNVDVGIAVAAPAGLVVPVVHRAELLTLAEIARARADLVERARAGKLRPEDLEGGTFTISNLGMYGVERFVAVLNPPQASILAVGATVDTVVPRDGEPVVRPLLAATLTCDHRAVDGAAGAEFLRTVKAFVEDPGLAL